MATVWTFALGLLLASCADTPPPAGFEIAISRGGGFTGLVRGYRLHDDGRVVAWSRMPGKRDSVLWQATAHADSVGHLRVELERSGALGTVHRRTGNMTTTITYSTRDSSFTWSWGSAGPENLREWYRQAHRFCAHLAPNKQ